MDKKAINILISTFEKSQKQTLDYWWKVYMDYINKEDFEYAKLHLTMFDPVNISHNEIFIRTAQAVDKIKKQDVVNAFLYSLSTRKLEYRSFLSSYCIGRTSPKHDFIASPKPNDYICSICGLSKYECEEEIELNTTNFFKYKQGSCFDSPTQILFDLEQFQNMPVFTPHKEDYNILQEIKRIIETSEPTDRISHLKRRIGPIVKSNDLERDGILEILGICGILHDGSHFGYSDHYVTFPERTHRPTRFDDIGYPARWWEGKFGVDQVNWEYWFGK